MRVSHSLSLTRLFESVPLFLTLAQLGGYPLRGVNPATVDSIEALICANE